MAGNASNELTGAEAMVRMLQKHGVKHIFGLCGDTSLPFYDALYRLDHGMEHILTRDERCAAYMADGYARVSGRVGVCEGPSGGGATYILPGLVEANESSMDDVVSLTFFVTDISRFGETQAARDAHFSGPIPPAMSGVEVAALSGPDWLVEVDGIAVAKLNV